MVQLSEDADFFKHAAKALILRALQLKTLPVNDFDGSKRACAPVDAKANVAIATFTPDSLANTIDLPNALLVLSDEVFDIDRKVVHLADHLLLVP